MFSQASYLLSTLRMVINLWVVKSLMPASLIGKKKKKMDSASKAIYGMVSLPVLLAEAPHIPYKLQLSLESCNSDVVVGCMYI